MHDPIDEYLDEVLSHASLAGSDARRVRAELKDHLQQLSSALEARSSSPEEILAMLNNEFGNPEVIGKAIANAKGRFRGYLKKQKRRLPITLAIAVMLAFSIRWAVAEEFYAASNAVAPTIPLGSRMLVYKLATTFRAGDVVVFRPGNGTAQLGIVERTSDDGQKLILARNGTAEQPIPRANVVGRVVLNTR